MKPLYETVNRLVGCYLRNRSWRKFVWNLQRWLSQSVRAHPCQLHYTTFLPSTLLLRWQIVNIMGAHPDIKKACLQGDTFEFDPKIHLAITVDSCVWKQICVHKKSSRGKIKLQAEGSPWWRHRYRAVSCGGNHIPTFLSYLRIILRS